MRDINNTNLQLNPEEEEAEEALSLCDLPLNKHDSNITLENMSAKTRIRSSSDTSDLFEFFSSDFSRSDQICSAEDIIFCGKLIPLNEQRHNSSPNLLENKKQIAFRKRSESLPGFQLTSVTRSNSTKAKLTRNSRSLDYRKLSRPPNIMLSPAPEAERNGSGKSVERNCSAKSDALAKKASKPRWYLFMFGMVKLPAEMELNDIKNRQVRRNPSKLFPANMDTPTTGKGSWKLLKALSCKDHASVAVSTSFCMPTA